MGHGLHDLARHNAWATAQLLDYCQHLDESALQATVPGTYGTIIETLRHLLNSEASYLFRLSGERPAPPQREWETVGIAALATYAAELTVIWERFLAGEVDIDRMGEGRGDDGAVFAIPAGLFITQAMHHGTEHRAHICTILGALGHEPPDVSAWGYGMASGRETLKSVGTTI